MSFSHLTIPTRDVNSTVAFFESTFRFTRNPIPTNAPMHIIWLNIGNGQELHVLFVPDFQTSAFELEFGRHVAFFWPGADLEALKARVVAAGATIVEPMRTTPFERFFFREPVNGYLFEVIDDAKKGV